MNKKQFNSIIEKIECSQIFTFLGFKLAGNKNHLWGRILYRRLDPTGGRLWGRAKNIFFCKNGGARKFWTALIGRARQKQNKKVDEPLIFLARPYKRRPM